MSTPSIALIPSGYKEGLLYSQLPINGDGDLDFARTTIANRVNEQGVNEEMAVNMPRLDYSEGGCPVLLLEPSRKNLFLNSEVGVTQSITVVSGVDYAVSFSGNGSITFSGGASGTLNGTGSTATDRVSQIVTTSSTSVTCTISGTVEYVNFEINTDDSSVVVSTSWIETNGTIETRAKDISTKTGLQNYINSSEGTFYFYGKALADSSNTRYISLSDNSNNNFIQIRISNSNVLQVRTFKGGGGLESISSTSTNTLNYYKCAIVWDDTKLAFFVNGIKIQEKSVDNSYPINTLDTLTFNNGFVVGGSNYEGKVKEFEVYTTAYTDSEAIDLTTI